jgi:hypothetical protein
MQPGVAHHDHRARLIRLPQNAAIGFGKRRCQPRGNCRDLRLRFLHGHTRAKSADD